MLVLRWIVMNTRTGMALRAVSFRFDTAALMGINVNRIISFAFVLGSALAAVAGVLVAISKTRVDPLMGLLMGLKAFVAAVLGGIGNIPGALLGGFLLGLTEVFVSAYLPHGSQYRDGVAFVILIVVLLVKPAGLLGSHVTEKV
jgi:branched-chain amino acid transport system permease protein